MSTIVNRLIYKETPSFDYIEASDSLLFAGGLSAPHQSTPMFRTGAHTPAGTLTIHTTPAGGKVIQNFAGDWYNRIHIIPETLDVGNMLSTHTSKVQVWNAYLTAQSLTAVTPTNASNITLSVGALPQGYNPLQLKEYTITVGTEGASTIDATYLFDFGVELADFYVIGNRAILWGFIPQGEFGETLSWKTAVIESRQDEKRHALMPAPRQSFDYTYRLTPREFSLAKATAAGWTFRVFGVPVWGEYSHVGPLTSGVTEILISTANADWREGEPVFIWQDNETVYAVQVKTVSADRLILENPLTVDFTNAYVAPLRFCRALEGFKFKRGPHESVVSDVSFTSFTGKNYASSAYPQFKNKDVVTDLNMASGENSERIVASIDIIDNGYGPVEIDTNDDLVWHKSPFSVDVSGRSEKWRIRKWLHKIAGKHKAFWLPTGNADFEILNAVNATATGYVVRSIGYAQFLDVKGVMVELNDGTKLYNQVLGSVSNGDGTEALTLYQQIGRTFQPADVKRASFMQHVRLDTDEVSIKHEPHERASFSVTVVEVPE